MSSTSILRRKIELINKIIPRLDYNDYNITNTFRDILSRSLDNKKIPEIKELWKDYFSNSYNTSHRLNFYFHTPFCDGKCVYCREASSRKDTSFDESSYAKYLIDYLIEFKDIFQDKTISSLYFGGGTPSLLSEESLDIILNTIFSNFKFDLFAEKTFEFNPNSMTQNKLDILSKYGMNRLSFGIQTLTKEVLDNVGRIQPSYEQIKSLIEYAERKEFIVINADMIIGLEGETKDTFLSSFEKLCALPLTDIYVYPLHLTDKYCSSFGLTKNDAQNNTFRLIRECKESMNIIAKKYGYSTDDSDIETNSIGFAFSKPDKVGFESAKLLHYNYIPLSPSSCFGVGLRAMSHIFGVAEYATINDQHLKTEFDFKGLNSCLPTKLINLDFEIIVYIARVLTNDRNLSIDEFNSFFSIDFTSRYNIELKYLKLKSAIEFSNISKSFKLAPNSSCKRLYQYLMLFMSVEQLEYLDMAFKK